MTEKVWDFSQNLQIFAGHPVAEIKYKFHIKDIGVAHKKYNPCKQATINLTPTNHRFVLD